MHRSIVFRLAAILLTLSAVPAHALTLAESLVPVTVAMAEPELAGGALPQLALDDELDLGVMKEIVATQAIALLGTSYEWGSKADDTVDCSSLVQRIYHAAGLTLPRTTREQVRRGIAVRVGEMRKGDLIFYRWNRRQLHVAVYMDDGFILHASSGKGRVVMTRLNANWRRRLVAVRRLI